MAVQAESSNQAADLGLVHQNRPAGEVEGADTVEHDGTEREAGRGAARQSEAAQAPAFEVEGLDAFPSPGCVGDDEAGARTQVESARAHDTARFGANLHEQGRRRAVGVDPVNRLPAPVEHEVPPVGRLLKDARFTERSYDMRRQPPGRAQNLDVVRGPGRPGQEHRGAAGEDRCCGKRPETPCRLGVSAHPPRSWPASGEHDIERAPTRFGAASTVSSGRSFERRRARLPPAAGWLLRAPGCRRPGSRARPLA